MHRRMTITMITMNKTPPMTPPTIAATSTLSTVAVRAGMFESVEVRLVVVVGVVVVVVVVVVSSMTSAAATR